MSSVNVFNSLRKDKNILNTATLSHVVAQVFSECFQSIVYG